MNESRIVEQLDKMVAPGGMTEAEADRTPEGSACQVEDA